MIRQIMKLTVKLVYNKLPWDQEEFEDTKGVIRICISKKKDNTMAKRYQRGNQNLYIKEEQTTQWPKEKAQKDKQRSTKKTHIKLKIE